MKTLFIMLFTFLSFIAFAQKDSVSRRASLPTISEIHFPENSSSLAEDDRRDLQVVAKHMLAHPEIGIVIIGHTDDIGDRNVNKKVALKRAKIVRDYLIEKGVEKNRIIYGGQGEDFPVFRDTTDYARYMNRRVTLRYKYLDE